MSKGQLIEDLIRLRDKLTSQTDRGLLAEAINRLDAALPSQPKTCPTESDDGNWICDDCRFLNRAKDERCRKCGARRPASTEQGGDTELEGGGHG